MLREEKNVEGRKKCCGKKKMLREEKNDCGEKKMIAGRKK